MILHSQLRIRLALFLFLLRLKHTHTHTDAGTHRPYIIHYTLTPAYIDTSYIKNYIRNQCCFRFNLKKRVTVWHTNYTVVQLKSYQLNSQRCNEETTGQEQKIKSE